jgi:hypothetical protein
MEPGADSTCQTGRTRPIRRLRRNLRRLRRREDLPDLPAMALWRSILAIRNPDIRHRQRMPDRPQASRIRDGEIRIPVISRDEAGYRPGRTSARLCLSLRDRTDYWIPSHTCGKVFPSLVVQA